MPDDDRPDAAGDDGCPPEDVVVVTCSGGITLPPLGAKNERVT